MIFDDLELFLADWFRAALEARPEPVCAGVTVRQVEPGPNETWPARLLVVRFDGSTRSGVVTDEASVGLTVFAGTLANPKDANDLARIVRAVFHTIPVTDPGNPVAAVLGSNGPIAVPDAGPLARRYITGELAIVGSAFI